MAEMEVRNTQSRILEAVEARRDRGELLNGCAPYGWNAVPFEGICFCGVTLSSTSLIYFRWRMGWMPFCPFRCSRLPGAFLPGAKIDGSCGTKHGDSAQLDKVKPTSIRLSWTSLHGRLTFLEAEKIDNGEDARRVEDGYANVPGELVMPAAFPHGDDLPHAVPNRNHYKDCDEWSQ